MIIIGFDVSKDELIGVRINGRAIVKERYTIPNTPAAIAEFLDVTQERHTRLVVGSEATAEYHRPLALACLARAITFRLLNPLVTKQLTRATIRKQKTDATDAFLIAKAILQGSGTAVTLESFAPGKTLNRTAVNLGRIAGSVLRMARHCEETEASSEIAALLRELRATTEDAMRRAQAEARRLLDPKVATLLQSISGIGPTLSVAFQTELAPIERFHDQKALVAYAGLDPRVKQSGVSLTRNTHLTKRGSPVLRRAAYLAASIAQRCDPELTHYYEKKRAEGKRYREATIANARHILYRVYAVWKRGTPYVKSARLATISTETA